VPALLNREEERAVLNGLLEDLRSGRGRVLVVRGEAGVGKSALLEYVATAAADMRVIPAAGVESEMELAFASLHQLCGPLLSAGKAADEYHREAIDQLSRTGLRTELARAHLLYGEWLRGADRRADARAQLRTAHDMFTAIGMEAFAERARHELLAAGETVRTRSAGPHDQLTPQETQIARLARGGLSNPEIAAQLFLSPRTVEYHLGKVFTKLDITSRRQLRQALP
jgi:DNA-binding CsgD family transcriptional regulator